MKKYLLVIIILICAFCSVAAFLMLKKSSHGFDGEEYTCDSLEPSWNYSENTVLYLDASGRLHLIETASGEDIICCDKPNCTHERYSYNNENPSCPAVFWGLQSCGPVLYNGQLYFIGNMSDDGSELTTQYLYEMDSNGENRRKVATLEGVQILTYALYRDNYVIGAYYNRIELDDAGQIINENKPAAGIYVIDLDNYKVHMGDKVIQEQANITGVYYEDGIVYYSAICFGDDITELMVEDAAENDYESFQYENLLYEIYQYDIASETTTLLKTFDHINALELKETDVYYESQDGYFVYDIISGENKELEIGQDAKNSSIGFHKYGDALYYLVFDNDGNEVVYRMENNESDELMRMNPEDSFRIECVCGSTVYVMYNDEERRLCLGAITLEDLDQGRFEPKWLRYYNEEE